ncbi:MAG: 30S ribosomal protein S14 [Holosporaceae bacterium]|jgi:small subunit ribosomal protein S14|nr:30S ribosomal protein S14 [Holosporaceae bacterium]
MASKSSIESAKRIRNIVKAKKATRDALKSIIMNRTMDAAQRFAAQLKLAAMPRMSSATRIRNRCMVTGRARGVYRKFNISRIMLREMAAEGLVPGVRKASW